MKLSIVFSAAIVLLLAHSGPVGKSASREDSANA